MSYNFGAYDNPEVTALIEQLSGNSTPPSGARWR